MSAAPQASAAPAARRDGRADPARVEFNRDVRPILSDKCYTCHGPGAQMATLRFDIEAGAKKALRGDRFAIVPGDPEHSELIWRGSRRRTRRCGCRSEGEPLTAREVEVLRPVDRAGRDVAEALGLHPAGAAGACRR